MWIIEALKRTLGIATKPSRAQLHRQLIHREAMVGGRLFGEVPRGHRRDFFYLGNNTWVWHELQKDESGRERILTTRYEIYPDKIIKAQDGQRHYVIEGAELDNFYAATRLYTQLVPAQVYGQATSLAA